MNNHQRGVYQPLMENVPIYDLEEDEVEGERSRLPLLIVIALIVLAAFTGVVWLAYNQGVARGQAGAVVINAPDGPVRTVPADPGGTTPFTGLKVYDQPLPPDQEAQSSALAQSTAPSAIEIAREPGPAPVTTEAPPARLNPQSSLVAIAPPAPQAVAPPPAPVAPARPAVAAAPAVAPAAGSTLLQIGAYESEEIANGAWATFRSRHTVVAGTLSQNIQKADLGDKGIWYRLRVGPFADKAAAVTACEKLKAEGATCFLATP